MITSALVAMAGLASSALAAVLGWIAWLGLSYMIEAVRLLADLPFASLELRGFNTGDAVVLYALLGAPRLVDEPPPARPRDSEAAAATGSEDGILRRAAPLRVIPTVWLAGWSRYCRRPRLDSRASLAPGDRLEVKVFDVGQGDAIFIRTPDGHKLLVDGGPSGRLVQRALGDELSFWDRKIDMVILTHPDDDHLAGW